MSSKENNNKIVVENTPSLQLSISIDNLLLITITITSNSINENTNNSIVGNTYLYFLQNKNIQQ